MRKIFLGLSAVGLAVASIPLFAAFEAHVINVTARIENALRVDTRPIKYGTVFPEEKLDKLVTVGLSGSFMEEPRVDDVNYILRQKPKCGITSQNGQVLDETSTTSGEPKLGQGDEPFIDCGPAPRPLVTGETWGPLPLLCRYLSKHDADPEDQNDDRGLDAFHEIGQWSGHQWTWNDVRGKLAKSQNDPADTWILDLVAPCFKGQCAQDNVVPPEYQADPADEHKIFGCDLWVEVTGVSRVEQPGEQTTSLSLENKDTGGDWHIITGDGIEGTLVFNSSWPTFKYTLTASGLQPNTSYSLIYYADGWPGNNPGALIGAQVTDGGGGINTAGDVELNLDLPTLPDANFPGAKIWLIPSSDYDAPTRSLTAWNPANYLFEYNLVTYDDTQVP